MPNIELVHNVLNLFNVLDAQEQNIASTLISLWDGHQNNKNGRRLRNLENSLKELKYKMQFNIQNIELTEEDANLLMSIFEEMEEIYTTKKRDCITNLVANIKYEKEKNMFEICKYQAIFEQLKQMYDSEILLLKEIYFQKDNLNVLEKKDDEEIIVLSFLKIKELENYDEFSFKRLENLAFLKEVTGFAYKDTKGEYIYNKTIIETFFNKTCELLYKKPLT